jgi:hypothetical protein
MYQTNASIITTLSFITFRIEGYKGIFPVITKYSPFSEIIFITFSNLFIISESPYLTCSFNKLSANGASLFFFTFSALSLIFHHKINLPSHPECLKLFILFYIFSCYSLLFNKFSKCSTHQLTLSLSVTVVSFMSLTGTNPI